MANEENLVPLSKRTKNERREIAQQGGKASGRARRKKANLKKALDLLLTTEVASEQLAKQLEIMGFDTTNEMALVFAIFQKAVKGDVRAFEQISRLNASKDEHDIAEQKAKIKLLKAQLNQKVVDKDTESKDIQITIDYGDDDVETTDE